MDPEGLADLSLVQSRGGGADDLPGCDCDDSGLPLIQSFLQFADVYGGRPEGRTVRGETTDRGETTHI